jgi:hypothetical protein
VKLNTQTKKKHKTGRKKFGNKNNANKKWKKIREIKIFKGGGTSEAEALKLKPRPGYPRELV